jgi:hypothetical protein
MRPQHSASQGQSVPQQMRHSYFSTYKWWNLAKSYPRDMLLNKSGSTFRCNLLARFQNGYIFPSDMHKAIHVLWRRLLIIYPRWNLLTIYILSVAGYLYWKMWAAWAQLFTYVILFIWIACIITACHDVEVLWWKILCLFNMHTYWLW